MNIDFIDSYRYFCSQDTFVQFLDKTFILTTVDNIQHNTIFSQNQNIYVYLF